MALILNLSICQNLIFKVQNKNDDDEDVIIKRGILENYTNCSCVPEENMNTLAKTSVVLDEYIKEYHLDALTLRCWNEMEDILHITPCVLLGELNDRGIIASCEMDLCSALTMKALSLASEEASTCLDWNNNYGEEEIKLSFPLWTCSAVIDDL